MPKKQLLEIPYPVKTEDLEVGMFITLPRGTWHRHPFLLSRFLIRNEDTIRIIMKSGIFEVMCNPTKSKVSPRTKSYGAARTVKESTTSEEEITHRMETLWESKERVKSQVDKRSDQFQKNVALHVERIRVANELEKMILAGAPSQTISDLIDEEWNQVRTQFHEAENDINISIINNSTKSFPYHHGVNTAALSVILAIQLGYSGEDLRRIVFGALFHDIGINFLPQSIRHWKKKPTKKEWRERRLHIKEGVSLLKKTGLFDDEILKIVEQHHERQNGLGYFGLKGEDISPLSKVVIICNYYDRQINHPVASERITPHMAIQEMYKFFRERFDRGALVSFIQLMGIYPAGSIVKLSDGNLGAVVGVYKDDIMNPEVIIYDSEINPRDALFLRVKDLGVDVKIVADVVPSSLPNSVRAYLNFSETVNYTLF